MEDAAIMTETVTITLDEAYHLAAEKFIKLGLSKDHAEANARLLQTCQRDECDSHGLYRVLSCAQTIKTGAVVLDAVPELEDRAGGIVRVDAKGGYSLLAFEKGLPVLVEKARTQGIAAMAINNCVHFSALWPEVEMLAEQGLVSLAMVPSHAWVAPAGGKTGVFGTNPIAFGWPRADNFPFIFDFATSAAARGEIELYRRAGKAIPLGWAVDKDGEPTTDAQAAMEGAMLTFGSYKGSALSAMVELLAGPLIGDMLSLESQAWDNGRGATPLHGEILIAFNPESFLGAAMAEHMGRAETMFSAITDQGARLPSQRRYEARKRSLETGTVTIPKKLYDDISAL
ncbi:Delta(1)-pyrroline-2-carboxylate/Delta(1)-piperideine-2-carboxylate reductase [Pseudochrobactrum sp. MP213Fo]